MSLKELGIALRESREAKGLDIEDAAIRIKVSARVLRAIEEGDQSGLPHAVYARGFIKSYALLLGVDNDLVMRAVDETYPFEVPEDLLPATAIVHPKPSVSVSLSPLVLALAALVLLVALGGGWYYRQQSAREADMPKVAQPAQSAQPAVQPQSVDAPPADVAPDQPVPVQEAAPAPAAVPAVNATTPVVNATLPMVNATVPATQPARNATAAATATAPAQTPAAAPAAVAAPVAAPTATSGPQGGVFDSEAAASGADTDSAVLAGGTHRIVVIALADCWVHSSADDSDVRQFSLHKGQTFALTFSKRLTLKLGNAGGVRIRYNGQEQPAAGDSGQVRTLVFPPQEQ